MSDMAKLRYSGASKTMDAWQFGLPQRRRRTYLVFQRSLANPQNAEAALDEAFAFRCRGPPSDALLALGETSLEQRSPVRRQWRKAKQEHRQWRRAHGVTVADVRRTLQKHEALRSRRGLTCRERDLLASMYAAWCKRGVDPRSLGLVLQIDQGIGRLPSSAWWVPCVVPGGRYWSTRGECLLPLRALLAAQGFGVEERRKFPALSPSRTCPRLLRDLNGNAFALNVFIAVLCGVLLHW